MCIVDEFRHRQMGECRAATLKRNVVYSTPAPPPAHILAPMQFGETGGVMSFSNGTHTHPGPDHVSTQHMMMNAHSYVGPSTRHITIHDDGRGPLPQLIPQSFVGRYAGLYVYRWIGVLYAVSRVMGAPCCHQKS